MTEPVLGAWLETVYGWSEFFTIIMTEPICDVGYIFAIGTCQILDFDDEIGRGENGENGENGGNGGNR